MGHHHHVGQIGIDHVPIGFELDRLPHPGDIHKPLMGIRSTRPMAGKMLERRRHACAAMRLDKCRGQRGNLNRISAIGALIAGDDRIVGVDIEIDHRPEIDVEPQPRQIAGQTGIDCPGAIRRLGRNGACRGNLIKSDCRREPLDLPALLVERDERRQPWTRRDQAAVDAAHRRKAVHIDAQERHATDFAPRDLFTHGPHASGIGGTAPKAHHDHLPRHILKALRRGGFAGHDQPKDKTKRGKNAHGLLSVGGGKGKCARFPDRPGQSFATLGHKSAHAHDCGQPVMFGGEQFDDYVFSRAGTRKEIPLPRLAPGKAQKPRLILVLDALGDHMFAQ